jgi:hypothetical protein
LRLALPSFCNHFYNNIDQLIAACADGQLPLQSAAPVKEAILLDWSLALLGKPWLWRVVLKNG